MYPMKDPVQQEAPVPAAESQVFQSRWGYHSVSREDFVILKALHRRYWRSVRLGAEWTRWARKSPQNRVRRQRRTTQGPGRPHTELVSTETWLEPPLDPKVHDRGQAEDFKERPARSAMHWSWLKIPLPLALAHQDYHEARIPRRSPAEVRKIDMRPYLDLWALIG